MTVKSRPPDWVVVEAKWHIFWVHDKPRLSALQKRAGMSRKNVEENDEEDKYDDM